MTQLHIVYSAKNVRIKTLDLNSTLCTNIHRPTVGRNFSELWKQHFMEKICAQLCKCGQLTKSSEIYESFLSIYLVNYMYFGFN